MRLPILYLLLICVWVTITAEAQKTNNVWAFGYHAGLDFNTDPPSYIDSTAIEGEAPPYYAASICDKDGKLLFYTDGVKVWNRRNKAMEKYLNRWPWSGKVMPLVCPYPGEDSLYYLFGISDLGAFKYGLHYLTIDMKGNRTMGEIVYPQPSTLTNYFTTLLQGASLLLAGTAHCNGKDTWVVTYANGNFYSFLVTQNGVSPAPVVSAVPPDITGAASIDGGYSNIKFAANGEKLLLPLKEENKMAIFDFDNSTGTFSGALKLGLPDKHTLEDIELSPDATKLYIGAYAPEIRAIEPYPNLHYIYQMDLNAGSATAIEATLTRLNNYGDREACSPKVCFYVHRTLQLTPDGRILVGMREVVPLNLDLTASIIQYPGKAGIASFYRKNAINLNRQYRFINYNYIRSGSYSLKENGIVVQKKTCADRPVEFSLLFSKVDAVKWDFGDPRTGANNTSTELAPKHQYPGPGTYTAKALIYTHCAVDTAYRQVVIEPDQSVQVPSFIKDTVVCLGKVLELDAAVPNATTYAWDNGLIYSKRTMDTAGHYAITISNECSMDRREFKMVYEKCPCDVFIPTAFTPNNDGLNDLFKPVVKCVAKDYRFTLFNRYGNVYFESSDPQKGWNGKSGSQDAPAGVYVWSVQYRDAGTRELFYKRGTVMLIR